jgi:hypothetical protein
MRRATARRGFAATGLGVDRHRLLAFAAVAGRRLRRDGRRLRAAPPAASSVTSSVPTGTVVPLRDQQLCHHPGLGRDDLGVDLLGRDLAQHLILGDALALAHEPALDGPLDHALAHLRHRDAIGMALPLHVAAQKSSARSSAASAACITISPSVGCAWLVSPTSRTVDSSVIARRDLVDRSVAPCPIIWQPRISPYFASETSFTKPSVWPVPTALPEATNGALPTFTSWPAARASARQADARHLRLAVDAGRNLPGIDTVLALTRDDLDHGDTFV